MSHVPDRDEWQLADYASVLRRGWWLVIAIAVIGLLGGAGYYSLAHKVYAASASIYVTPAGETASQAASGGNSSEVNLDTEAQVAQSATIAQAAAKLMHSTGSLPALINRVGVTVPANSQVLQISCRAGSAANAATCAQSFAQAFLAYSARSTQSSANSQIASLQAKVSKLESAAAGLSVEVGSLPGNSSQRADAQQRLRSDQSQLDALNSQIAQLTAELANPYGGSIISSARPPASPSSPKKLLVLPGGLLAGLLAGLIAAFVRDRRDHRIRGPRDLIRKNVPVLLALPTKSPLTEPGIAAPRSQLGRDFARLAHVVTGTLGAGSHVILVTGARPGHGTSLVAANLAVALSRNQPDVTLVCADIKESVIPALVGLPPGPGLADLLAAESPGDDPGDRVAVAPRLRVIAPGSAARDDAQDLRQDCVESLLTGLRTTARWIVVEAPSIMADPDAYTLAQAADAAVLVVEVPWATDDQLLDSVAHLERMGATVLGAAVLPALKTPLPRYAPAPAPAPVRRLPASDSDDELTAVVDWDAVEEMPNSAPRS